MKNAINYFYNIYVGEIHKVNKRYEFEVKNNYYLLMPCNRTTEEIDELYQISLFLARKNLFCHQFVFNKNNEIVTTINNVLYVLLITSNNQKENITINDIERMSQINITTKVLDRTNWYQMWQSKVDYIEYQMSQFGKKYKYINNSFNYYIGLAETAISVMQYVPKEYQKTTTITHKRIKYNTSLIDFYNPLNFIVDYKFRDIVEFFKSQFFHSNLGVNEVIKYLQYSNLNKIEIIILFARFLFPTYYFDLFEEVVLGDIDETILLKVLNKTHQYELFIKELYKKIRIYISIPEIEWLEKEVIQH